MSILMTAPVTESQLFHDLAIVFIFFFTVIISFWQTQTTLIFLSVYSAFSGPQLRITIVYNKGYHFG